MTTGDKLFGASLLVLFVGSIALGASVWQAAFLVFLFGAPYIKLFRGRGHRKPRVRIPQTHSRTIPQSVKIAVTVRDQGRCRHCGNDDELQYDHVVPFSLGGRSDDPSNIQLLCGRCNRRKSNRFVG